MFFICGYNFCQDGNCIDVAPVITQTMNKVQIENGIFDHINISSDISTPYSPDIPTQWDERTIMDCNFEENVNAGNVNFSLDTLNGFYIKRKKSTEFQWVNLKFIPISEISDFRFAFDDNLAAGSDTYQYAIVPVLNGIEGDYFVSEITTNFRGVYLCDQDTIREFRAGVEYGNSETIQKTSVFEPFGRKYPIVISNADTAYEKGSVKGTILNTEFYSSGKIDRKEITRQRNALTEFLTNKKPKILKDWNGNNWLISIVDNPTTAFYNDIGMGIADISFNYVEVGNSESQEDLVNSGILPEVNI